MSQAFNPSNEPGTCLWCGRELHMEYRTEWEPVNFEPKRCKHCKSKRLTKDGYGYYCQDCQGLTYGTKRKVKSREPRHENVGLAGKGLFDTGRCAELFGWNAARLGFRLQPIANAKGKTA